MDLLIFNKFLPMPSPFFLLKMLFILLLNKLLILIYFNFSLQFINGSLLYIIITYFFFLHTLFDLNFSDGFSILQPFISSSSLLEQTAISNILSSSPVLFLIDFEEISDSSLISNFLLLLCLLFYGIVKMLKKS